VSARVHKVLLASGCILTLLCLCSGLLPACNGSPSVTNNPYSQYLSLKGDSLAFEAPFVAILNDSLTTRQAKLKTGDSLRIPQTEEAGEILKVIEITDNYALVEYRRYSAPPAENKQEKYRFKIYPAGKQ
jgi:hypothetical protein